MLRTLTVILLLFSSLTVGSIPLAAAPAGPAPPPPPETPVSADKAPPLSLNSTAKDLDAYVQYYQQRGYMVTYNQQLFDRQGKVGLFRFAAERHHGRDDSTTSAGINAATHTVTRHEQTKTTYTYNTKT